MSDIVKDARELAENLTGKPRDEVGWRDVSRLGSALLRVADECDRVGRVVGDQAERMSEARNLARAIEDAASDGRPLERERIHGLAEKLRETLEEEV